VNASREDIAWVLLAFGLWPTTFFFRMGYSESLFILCALLTLHGIMRGWPLVPLALTAGVATGVRPVGLAVTFAFLFYVVQLPGTWAARLGRAIACVPLAAWGLLVYMGYLYRVFGNPLAFVQTQEHWTFPVPPANRDFWAKALSLATLEPIRGVYDSVSPRFWSTGQVNDNPVFNLTFWNPILFIFASALLTVGAGCRWITGPELVLGVGLLIMPYCTRAYEMSMASHGRFAAVVISNYLVMGRLLATLPVPVACVVVSVSAVVLVQRAVLYTAGYLFF
jgi:hypothetical protein